MNLSDEDNKLLLELCAQHDVNFSKIVKLLATVREYEFKDRRSGIYEALREIVKAKELAGDGLK